MNASDAAPPAGPGDDLPAVAPQLRALRRRAGLTLEAAARSAGLSPAHLSRLETGGRQPSLPMLLALARIYGTTVSELLGETAADRDAIVRAADMEPTRAGGWTYFQAGASGRGMQALRVRVPYGTQGDIVRVHPGEEWLYVLKGRLRLRLGDTAHLLATGERALRLPDPAPARRRGPRRRGAAVRPHPAAESHGRPVSGPVDRRAAMSDYETRFPRSLWIRLIIYIAVGHLFAAFLYLLFALGAKS